VQTLDILDVHRDKIGTNRVTSVAIVFEMPARLIVFATAACPDITISAPHITSVVRAITLCGASRTKHHPARPARPRCRHHLQLRCKQLHPPPQLLQRSRRAHGGSWQRCAPLDLASPAASSACVLGCGRYRLWLYDAPFWSAMRESLESSAKPIATTEAAKAGWQLRTERKQGASVHAVL
jgi:hypothetical protein